MVFPPRVSLPRGKLLGRRARARVGARAPARSRPARGPRPDVAGRFDHAARWAQEGVEASPDSYWGSRVVAASAFHAGAREAGRRIVRQLLRKDPSLTAAVARRAWPFPAPVMARLAEGLVAAGMPRD
jgi:hypothetical protein